MIRPEFGPLAGKKFREVLSIAKIVGDLCQDILHPDTRFDAGVLAGADERVHDGSTVCRCIIAAEEPVLAFLCWQCSYVGIVVYWIIHQFVSIHIHNIMYRILP